MTRRSRVSPNMSLSPKPRRDFADIPSDEAGPGASPESLQILISAKS
jgi:hypothetical protein